MNPTRTGAARRLVATAAALLIGLQTAAPLALARSGDSGVPQGAFNAPNGGGGSPFAQTPASPQILATVNGEKVSRPQFMRMLMTMDGMALFQKWVQLIVLRQAIQKAGLHVGRSAIKAEREKIYAGLAKQHIPRAQRPAVLARMLAQRGVTPLDFNMQLTRSAYLHALSRGKVHVTPAQEKTFYDYNYGPKLILRDIVVKDIRDAAFVRDLIEKKHEPVAQVAAQNDINPQTRLHGGLTVLPLAQKNVPAVYRDTAIHLKRGKLSPAIFVGDAYHLLWLVKKVPRSPIKFAKIKSGIKTQLTDDLRAQWSIAEMNKLISHAHVKVNDPILAAQFAQMREQQMRQAAALKQQNEKRHSREHAKKATTKPFTGHF